MWLGDSWREQNALSLAKVQSQPAGAEMFGEGKRSFLDDSEVLTHHDSRLRLISIVACPVFFQRGMSLKQGDRKAHESASRAAEPSVQCVVGSAIDLGHTVQLYSKLQLRGS